MFSSRGLSRIDPVSFHDVGQILNARQDARELGNIRNLNHQLERREIVGNVDLDVFEVDIFIA